MTAASRASIARSSGSTGRSDDPPGPSDDPPGQSDGPADAASPADVTGGIAESTNLLALRIFTASRLPILNWPGSGARSEERRVGEEWRSRSSTQNRITR